MHIRRWLPALLAAFIGHAAAEPPLDPAPEPPPVSSFVITTIPESLDAAAPTTMLIAAAVDDPLFPHLPVLATSVAFWTRVFADWSENQSVVHSADDLGKVYSVLDFRADAPVLDAAVLASRKQAAEKQALADLDRTLTQLQAMQDAGGTIDSATLSADQRKVYELFADSADPKRFGNAVGSFRVQRGLRERTQKALETSSRYLPAMERIFASYGLPTKLTRLPLVESSFDVEAYSRAAAAGLWQFIPSSARIYMRLDDIVDDRRDPWLSTDAAARHLKDDYDALGSWPLALTAYNYGRSGLLRALAEVNGTTLGDVLERYQGQRFGFASSNFYAEFLAATDIEQNYRAHFGDLRREPPLAFDTVITQDYVSYETLRRLCGSDDEEFQRLNPAYRPSVVAGRLYVPPGETIRVPQGSAQRFELAYATLSAEQRFDHQRHYYASHRVARGDSVGELARHYGVSAQEIVALNGLRSARLIRVGQTLKIPLGDDGGEAPAATAHAIKVKAAVAERAVARATRIRTHRVRAGQTLSAIALRYQTTISGLRELNGLHEGDILRVGTTLKIPD